MRKAQNMKMQNLNGENKMKEIVEFSYYFESDGSEGKEVNIYRKAHEDGLTVDTLCEAFLEFMESSGFSESQVYKYFS